jgi:hypothetical protein
MYSCRCQIVRVVVIRSEGDRPRNALACYIGVAQSSSAKTCLTDRSYGCAGKFPETIRVKEAAAAREVGLRADEVAAIVAYVCLSVPGKTKARGATLALSEVEYLVRQQAGGG